MVDEIEEIMDDSIEDIAVDSVIENDNGNQKKKPRWENWVALSSSLFAVLSAIAALLAIFASDEAAIAESAETVYSAYKEGVSTSYYILQTKMEILDALDKPAIASDKEQLIKLKKQMETYKAKAEKNDKEGRRQYQVHDMLAIGVTLFQVAILMGGFSILMQRPGFWVFGMVFMIVGLGFMAKGLIFI